MLARNFTACHLKLGRSCSASRTCRHSLQLDLTLYHLMFSRGGVLRRYTHLNELRWTLRPAERCNSTASSPKVIFSGIQPTGVPHLGNYLGALRQWVRLQDEAPPSSTLIYSLVDLHAITVRQHPAQLRQWRRESLAMLLAIGLGPERSIIFHQSDASAHSELMWILSCRASTGYLGRMTQWKDKTANEKEGSERMSLGLFSYPVLQAADILVHGATHVPVGHDQAQHLEFTRQLANGFNNDYASPGSRILVPPETLVSPAKRIMSLTDPTAKMSKSAANPKSRILLTDSESEIRRKVMAAVTDSIAGISYDPNRRPGVSNLVELLYHTRDGSDSGTLDELADQLRNVSMRALKEQVARSVELAIKPIREHYEAISQDQRMLDEVAMSGAAKARESASLVLQRVKEAVGLA